VNSGDRATSGSANRPQQGEFPRSQGRDSTDSSNTVPRLSQLFEPNPRPRRCSRGFGDTQPPDEALTSEFLRSGNPVRYEPSWPMTPVMKADFGVDEAESAGV
jgi:hypothetical protein